MPDAIPLSPGDIDTATRTLFGECRGEPLEGQQGVAWVIRRRVRPGHSVEAVCIAHDQFSCWLENDPNRSKLLALQPEDPEFKHLLDVVRSVMAGEVNDPTNGANHYLVTGTHARWIEGHAPTAVIGKHSFYNVP